MMQRLSAVMELGGVADSIAVLALQIRVNPFFQPDSPVIRCIELDAERSILSAPSHVPANPDAWQRQKCKRNFNQLSGLKCVRALQRHSPRTHFLGRCGNLRSIRQHHANFSHYRNAHIPPEFVKH